VSKHFNPAVIPNNLIFNHKCIVFAVDQPNAIGALLNSSPVQAWVWKQSARLGFTLSFSPSDAVGTFPFPDKSSLVGFETMGAEYMLLRRELMITSAIPIGLTKLYNRFHDPQDGDSRIVRLREMHREIDAAVMRAYGWDDFALGHGFHEQANLAENDCVRFTLSDAARAEVLGRFAELNRKRYEEERASAPIMTPRAKGSSKATAARQAALAFVDVLKS
jgi:hypothetical protein